MRSLAISFIFLSPSPVIVHWTKKAKGCVNLNSRKSYIRKQQTFIYFDAYEVNYHFLSLFLEISSLTVGSPEWLWFVFLSCGVTSTMSPGMRHRGRTQTIAAATGLGLGVVGGDGILATPPSEQGFRTAPLAPEIFLQSLLPLNSYRLLASHRNVLSRE